MKHKINMEIQKNIKRITILDGFSFPSDDEDDFFLNGDEPDKDSSAFSKTASNTVTGQMHNNKTQMDRIYGRTSNCRGEVSVHWQFWLPLSFLNNRMLFHAAFAPYTAC